MVDQIPILQRVNPNGTLVIKYNNQEYVCLDSVHQKQILHKLADADAFEQVVERVLSEAKEEDNAGTKM